MRRNNFRYVNAQALMWEAFGVSEKVGARYAELLSVIEKAMEEIDPRQALVLRMRFGIGKEGIPQTFQQIGESLDVSIVAARQRVMAALQLLAVNPEIKHHAPFFTGLIP
jgi:DNA-directed RNA polymerase sigma subunit (sigma70/sigma32)